MGKTIDSMVSIPTPVHGGHDPDDMQSRREGWGAELAAHVASLTGTDPDDAVADAISYLLHHAHATGQGPATQLHRAVRAFNEETSEEG